MDSKVVFECEFFDDQGALQGIKVYNATESPNNQIITYQTLLDLVTEDYSDIIETKKTSAVSLAYRADHGVLECDEDLRNAVSKEVKLGQYVVHILVTSLDTDWEIVSDCENPQTLEPTEESHIADAELGPKELLTGSAESETEETFHVRDSTGEEDASRERSDGACHENDLDGCKESKHDPAAMENISNLIVSEEVIHETDIADSNPTVIDSPFGAQEKTEGQRILQESHQNTQKTSSDELIEAVTTDENLDNGLEMEDENVSVPFSPPPVQDHLSMATSGCFRDTTTEWTQASFSTNHTPREHEEWAKEEIYGTSGETEPKSCEGIAQVENPSEFLNSALNDIEKLLGENPEDDAMSQKYKLLLSNISTIVSEVLTLSGIDVSSSIDSVSQSGLGVESEVLSLRNGFFKVGRDRDAVTSIQRFLASTAVTDLVLDLASNEISKIEDAKGMVLNHLGDLLPELGKVFRQAPQILVLVPHLLLWLVATIQHNGKVSQNDAPSDTQAQIPIHTNIICDGCESSDELKTAAIHHGTVSGCYIKGDRYKSAIVSNFDLCATCESSGLFESHEPFLKIRNSSKAPVEIVCVLPGRTTLNHPASGAASSSDVASQSCATSNDPGVGAHPCLVCPKKQHPLLRFRASGHRCDECNVTPSNGAMIYGCRICDWDICSLCSIKKSTDSQAVSSGVNQQESGKDKETSAADSGISNLTCPDKNHPLLAFSSTGHCCNSCQSIPPNGSLMHGCRTCDWDICGKCIDQRTDREQGRATVSSAYSFNTANAIACPEKSHPLKRFHVPNRFFACDVCDRKPSVGSLMFGCRACDWDICSNCAEINYPGLVVNVSPSPSSPGANDNQSRRAPVNADSETIEIRPRSKFVRDVTIPDGAILSSGETFVKIWKVQNTSNSVPWPVNSRIVCVGGDMMGSPPEGFLIPPTPPGGFANICVQLNAPRKAGRYVGYWRLVAPRCANRPNDIRFGQRLWIDLTVSEELSNLNLNPQANGVTHAPDSPVEENAHRWSFQLQKLEEMNFLDRERNIELLSEVDGDLERMLEKYYGN
mmetsp:Transcript_13724/g.15632  ORF Transcript_13724/g.15632 Transcript_13724/m.15632 type:complete len:1054 (-) Transcript_13724:2346-5507(-)